MTKDNIIEHLSQDLTSYDTEKQQQQKPFQVVLVDIKEAADGNIICVEKPLEEDEEELNFVALSYRWGELHEQLVNTQLGYLGRITSFDLNDFYKLCKMMMNEPDLKSIKYVWVDAICVDQTNYERRKATIHQMSSIYNKATYILAIPDLHKQHLNSGSLEYRQILENISTFNKYIYHLIQGNTKQLVQMDEIFLDYNKAPKDCTLRKLLAEYTPYLAHGFTTLQDRDYWSDGGDKLVFLCEIYQASKVSTPHEDLNCIKYHTQSENAHVSHNKEPLLDYNKVANLFLDNDDIRWKKIGKSGTLWIFELIKRGDAIRQAMRFLEDLIIDWSTRAWVISEYHIAKKKNNLKYWFIQLSTRRIRTAHFPFFKFDFINPAFSSDVKKTSPRELSRYRTCNSQLSFHNIIIKQLTTQAFLEMMLKSKASKNEDRFYAILPQSKYKDKVNQVDQWNITTLMSVKLKLFEIMDTKDKWTLLFLSGNNYATNTYQVLPTFCASNIYWQALEISVEGYPYNYDMNNESSAITLHRTNHLHLNYLRLTPKEYYIDTKPFDEDMAPKAKKTLYNHLQVDKDSLLDIVILLPYVRKPQPKVDLELELKLSGVVLIGSFVENKWTFCDAKYPFSLECVDRHYNDDHSTVFDIY
ncbi:unnamed protein product [Absidia cylindrospora]